MKKIFLLTVLILYSTSTVFAARFYVKTDGSDNNDGLSWNTAFASVTAAISSVNNDALINEIWVANGRYIGTYTINIRGLLKTRLLIFDFPEG